MLAGDAGKKTAKNHMLVDMSTERHQKNQCTATTLQHTTKDSEPVNHFAKKTKKTSKADQQRLGHMKDAESSTYNSQTTNYFDQPGFKGMSNQIDHEHGRHKGDLRRSSKYAKCIQLNEIYVPLDQRYPNAQIDQMFAVRKCSSKDGVNLEPRQFSDAVEKLKSKRRLFPQSLECVQRDTETVKHFVDNDFSGPRIRSMYNSEISKCSTGIDKQMEENLSYKKLKDIYTNSSYKSSSPQPSNKIVVLRSAPKVMETPEHVTCSCSSLHSHQHFERKGQNDTATYFSLKQIKKRWKRAMGQNQEKRHWFSSIVSFHKIPPRKWINTEAGDNESPGFSTRKASRSSARTTDRDKSQKKRDFQSRNGPEISKTDETVCRVRKPSARSYSKHPESWIFQEAKMHLSERLRNVNRSEILANRQTVRTLERILFSPEYDSYSPRCPQWNMKSGFISTERTFSSRFSVEEDHSSESDGKVAQLTPILDFGLRTTHATVGTSASECDSKSLDTNDTQKQEDPSTFEIPSEPCNTDFTCARHEADTNCEGDGFDCSMLDSPSLDQIIRSSFNISPSSPQQMVDNMKDEEEHQSPVSVLEPLLTDDAGSPKNIKIQSTEGPLQPLQIDYEEYSLVSPRDPKIERFDCMNEDKAISAYMRAVLQAAGLNWEVPLLTRPSSDQVLHASFSHEEKLSEAKLQHDPKVLFDCVNDVMLEVYQQYFGCSPWTSYLKPNSIAFPLEDHLVNEGVKQVEYLLLPLVAQPALDQLVGHDIAKSTSWLDIRIDTEELVNQIAEAILEDSVMDTILSCGLRVA